MDDDVAQFVAVHGRALLRLAFLLTLDRHLAEDLVQETLIKVHRRWRTVARADAPEAYVRRMLVNEHLSWRRRRSSSEVVGVVSRAGRSEDPVGPDPYARLDDRDTVWQLLAGLPRQQRAAVVLRYYEDLDDTTSAALLGCAPATVRSHVSAALVQLRLVVGEQR